MLHWDAAAAGVADAEAATGHRFVLGGPGAGKYPGASHLLPLVFAHLEGGRNAWTGAASRLDFLSIHYKGRNTSYLVSELALEGFTWMRQPGHGAGAVSQALPFSNDEGDPLVSWIIPLEWRGDARYGAIVPKVRRLRTQSQGKGRGVRGGTPLRVLPFAARGPQRRESVCLRERERARARPHRPQT